VLLKDILAKAEIDAESPKVLSKYYVECVASDNYKIVFSWNEIFNSDLGNNILVITQKDGENLESYEDRIAIISASDRATGRRHLKGLQKVLVRRAD
jgi:hypothetical protein